MAQYSHLPIYKVSYDLLIRLVNLVKHYPKEFKYTLGEKIQNSTIELLINIYKANSAQNKKPYIEKILEELQFLNLFMRISKDLKIITEETYARYIEMAAQVSKQASGWLASVCG